MSVELVGKDQVAKYIKLSGKRCFEIYRQNDGTNAIPVHEFEGQNENNAADNFLQWASIADSNGTNWTPYRITVHNGTDATKTKQENGAAKRWNSQTTSFALNAQNMGMSMGTPVKQNDGSIVYFMPPQQQQQQQQQIAQPQNMTDYVAKSEVEKMLAHYAQNLQKDLEIQRLNTENIVLSRRLRDLEDEIYGDDEDEEDDEDEFTGERPWWETETGAKNVIGLVKDTMLEIKGNGSKIAGTTQKLNRVAGTETEELIVKIPEGAKPGSFPPFVTITEENKDLVHEDQQIKLQAALARLYKKDAHVGDDLTIIANIGDNKPNRFKGLIESLREE